MKAILEATERLYAAAAADDAWPAALEASADLFKAGHALIEGFAGSDGDGAFFAAARIDEGIAARAIDPEVMRFRAPVERLVPAGVSNRAAFMADHAFERSDYYNAIVRPLNGFHCLHARRESARASFGLSICRPRQAANFGEEEAALLRFLAPHVTMAVELRGRLRAAEARGDSLAQLIDRLATGVIVTDAWARPVLINTKAAEILDEEDGLRPALTGLVAATPAETDRLRDAVTRTASDSAVGGVSLRLQRPSGRSALLISVLPVWRLDGTAEGKARPRVAIFIDESDARPGVDRAAIAEVFGMTRRESDVAAAIAAGADLQTVAASLGLGLGTVRNHLKRVFEKTGTHSQAALVALLRGFAAR